jgi:serine/threonine protein kinase
VIDLGLVKPDRALRNAASPPTTEIGRMLCTPGYTSPEQAAGNPVDRRSDVYSMAVTLYRVLAGRLPFHDARGQPLALLAKHIYNAPTMLAEAAGTADIPVGVAAVVEGALSKDPAKRPQTMPSPTRSAGRSKSQPRPRSSSVFARPAPFSSGSGSACCRHGCSRPSDNMPACPDRQRGRCPSGRAQCHRGGRGGRR